MPSILNIDGNILLFIQEHIRNGFLDVIFPNLTHLGDAGIFWMILTVVLLCFKKTRRAGIYSAIALVVMLLFNNLFLKPLINRTRPYEVIQGLILIGKPATDPSFPSGHTCASFASCTAICKRVPKYISIPAFILAALIAFSRLYIGIHYPTDVLGGLIIGVAIGIAVNIAADRIMARRELKKAAASEDEGEGDPQEEDI